MKVLNTRKGSCETPEGVIEAGATANQSCQILAHATVRDWILGGDLQIVDLEDAQKELFASKDADLLAKREPLKALFVALKKQK